MKICNHCHIEKELTEFHNSKTSEDGRQPTCKQCRKERYDANKDELNRINRENYDPVKRRENYLKHHEYNLAWGKNNKEKKNAATRKFRKTEKYKTWRRNYRKNPQIKIQELASDRIRKVLKKQGLDKRHKSKELTGCEWWYLEAYLRATMTQDMSWKMFLNGELEIDHKIPCCAFNLTNEDELKKCFHYTNLRLLHKQDNSAKAIRDKKMSIHRKDKNLV